MTDVSLISSADNVSDARLHRLCAALIKSGLSVEVWALGAATDAPEKVEFHRAPGGRGFAARVLRDLTLPLRTSGKVVIVIAPDLLVTTFFITKLRGQKLVADVHEDYLRLLKDRAWSKGLIGWIAQAIALGATSAARNAHLTSVADQHVPPLTAKRRIVIRNLPDLDLITPSGEMAQTPRAIYIGDVRASRGLHTMLKSAELSPNWTFDIIGAIAPADQSFTNSWLDSSPARDRVHFHGKLPPAKSWKYAEGAWVGLSLLDQTPAFQDAIPSKLYEYLAAGLATISSSLPRCVALVEESQGGVIALGENEQLANSVARQLIQWENHPGEIVAIREQGRQWAQNHLLGAAEYQAFASAIKSLLI